MKLCEMWVFLRVFLGVFSVRKNCVFAMNSMNGVNCLKPFKKEINCIFQLPTIGFQGGAVSFREGIYSTVRSFQNGKICFKKLGMCFPVGEPNMTNFSFHICRSWVFPGWRLVHNHPTAGWIRIYLGASSIQATVNTYNWQP